MALHEIHTDAQMELRTQSENKKKKFFQPRCNVLNCRWSRTRWHAAESQAATEVMAGQNREEGGVEESIFERLLSIAGVHPETSASNGQHSLRTAGAPRG